MSIYNLESLLLFNFALEYAIRKVQETNLGLNMNGTHQVLAYADDVNLIGDDIRTIERNVEVLNACKCIGFAVNTEKIKCLEVGRHRGMKANKHSTVGSNSYEKVTTFKYLGSLVKNQNSIQEEIKCRFKSRWLMEPGGSMSHSQGLSNNSFASCAIWI